MQKSAAKAEAVRLLWFEFLANNPMGFELKKHVDGKLADFYSSRADMAIFVDSRQCGKDDTPGKLYFSSDEILNHLPVVRAKINCRIKLGLLLERCGEGVAPEVKRKIQ